MPPKKKSKSTGKKKPAPGTKIVDPPFPPVEQWGPPGDGPSPSGGETGYPVTTERRKGEAYVWLVRRTRDREHIPAVPMVMGAPNCTVSAPADGGKPLKAGNDYVVSEIKVFKGKWEDPASAPILMQPFSMADLEPSVRVQLRMVGSLGDPLEKIAELRAEVEDGDDFTFVPAKEFSDGSFKKWYPHGGGENVRVEGLGVHHIRLVPKNASGFYGRYHLDVSCEVGEGDGKDIRQATDHLNEVMEDSAGAIADPVGHAARIIASCRAVADAWRKALSGVEVRSKHNVHIPHSPNIGQSCYFRVRALPNAGVGQGNVEAEPVLPKPITYKSDQFSLLSDKIQPHYFVASENYPDSGPKTFDKDGLLRGEPDRMARGYYPPMGLRDAEVIYSVAAKGPACSHIKKGETVLLEAAGLPRVWKELTGWYQWSMVSYPEGATWEFDPPGPTPNFQNRLKVDRTGHYVVRVDYTLDNLADHCNQTFTIIDLKIVVEVEASVRLHRVGDYPAELAEHLGRPFYRRRTLERQEGADLLVTPVGAPDFGQRLDLAFTADRPLTLDSEFTARVYITPDRKKFRDYAGAPRVIVSLGVAAADMRLQSLERIYAVHIMRIRYGRLLDLPGHSVKVEVKVAPGEYCPGGVEESVTSGVVVDDGYSPPTTTTTAPVKPAFEFVNLVLYQNDLGRVPGKIQLHPLPGKDEVSVNAANGNMYARVALMAWQGRGMSHEFSLHCNSFHGQQMQAFERMAKVNRISEDELYLEYARNHAGYGWSHSYGVHCLDYVLSEEGARIRKRLEVVAADGNHIQLEEKGKSFRPCERGTVLEGDPVAGASLKADEVRTPAGKLKGYELTDFYGNKWSFDDYGKLTEMASVQADRSGGKLKPVRLSYSSGRIEVLDSAERRMILETGPRQRLRAVKDDTPRQWKLTSAYGNANLLQEIEWPSASARHAFEYAPDFYDLTSFTNRRGYSTAIEYARRSDDDWGKTTLFLKEGLRWSAHYEKIVKTPDCVTSATDTRGTEHRFTWDRDSLALKNHEAKRTRRTTPFRVLDAKWISLDRYRYFAEAGLGEGKLVTEAVDVYGFKVTSRYAASNDGRGWLCRTSEIDGRKLYDFEWDSSTNRVRRQIDSYGRATVHEYDAYGNQTKITYPALAGQAPGAEATETWQFHADGRLLSQSDKAGVRTVYAHGGPRDPKKIGLPTSETRGGLSWEYSYELCGKRGSAREPFFGGTTDYEFDELDRVVKTRLPEASAVTGADENSAAPARETWVDHYDPNGNLILREAPLGGNESATFDEHDRMNSETNSDGTMTIQAYDEFDGVLERVDRRGYVWTTRRDYLGREESVIHPGAGGGTMLEWTVHPDDGLGNRVEYLCGPLNGATGQVGEPRRVAESRYDWSGQLIFRERGYGLSPNAKRFATRWTYDRDDYGHLRSIELESHTITGSSRTMKESYDLDTWHRVKAVTVGNARTDYELGPRDEILAVTAPSHDGATRSTWRFEFDDFGRETGTIDPYGTVVRKILYDDAGGGAGATREYLGYSPAAAAANPRVHRSAAMTHQVLKRVALDARGQENREWTAGRPVANLYHDVRGRLALRLQGPDRSEFRFDGRGRRVRARILSAGVDQTVEQRFDASGNLIFLSGPKFDSSYEYDARDQFVVERRAPKGVASSEFRRVEYDIIGRPKILRAPNGVVTEIDYSEQMRRATYRVTGLPSAIEGSVLYGWNGAVEGYSRTIDGKTYSFSASDPDSCGRHRIHQSWYEGLYGKIQFEYHPAGTRRSMEMSWGAHGAPGSPIKRNYEYHPDWLLKAVGTEEGRYEFSYQANGALSAWRSPKNLWSTFGFNAGGEASAMSAYRVDGAKRFLAWETSVQPAAAGGAGKEHETNAVFDHVAGETPNSGKTEYASESFYDSAGRLTSVARERSGGGAKRIKRQVSFTYKPDGSLDVSREEHEFPQSPSYDFIAERRSVETSRDQTYRNTTPSGEPTLRSAHCGTVVDDRDQYWRSVGVRSESLFSPDTYKNWLFGWLSTQDKWMKNVQVLWRDELGRVMRAQSTPSMDAYDHSTSENPGAFSESWLYHGLDGKIGARRDVGTTPMPGANYTFQNFEYRLYLYDGGELMAEIGRSHTTTKTDYQDRLVRYYELGPGKGLRLAVRHSRVIDGAAKLVTDEYVYGPAMSPAALVGEPEDGSGGDSRIVRRFGLWDMPLPGDDRLERIHAGDAQDDAVLSPGSALFGAPAQFAFGGVPAGVSSQGVAAIGSAIGARIRDESLGSMLPHAGLFEYQHETDLHLGETGELGGLPDRSFLGALGRIVEFAILWNPMTGFIYRLNKSKALFRMGKFAEAKSEVTEGSVGLAMFAVGHAATLLSGLMGRLAGAGLSAYSRFQTLINLPNQLTLLAGRDPETGASLSWDERLTNGASVLSSVQFERGGPQVHSGHGCFPAGTEVWTPAGRRAIEGFLPGDEITAWSPAGLRTRRVTALHRYEAATVTIRTEAGELVASVTQPLLTAEKGWVLVRDLAPGMSLVRSGGEGGRIRAIDSGRADATVFNVSVETDETYLVGEQRFVAHNKPPTLARGVSGQQFSRGDTRFNIERMKKLKPKKVFEYVEHPFVLVRADDTTYLAQLHAKVPRPGSGKEVHADHVTAKSVVLAANQKLAEHHAAHPDQYGSPDLRGGGPPIFFTAVAWLDAKTNMALGRSVDKPSKHAVLGMSSNNMGAIQARMISNMDTHVSSGTRIQGLFVQRSGS